MPRQGAFLSVVGLLLSVQFGGAQTSSSPPPAKPPVANESAASPQAKDPLAVWQSMVVKEGNFSIIFPVNSKHEGTRNNINMQDGRGVETRFTAPTKEGNYQIAYTFLSENIATPQSIRQRFDTLLKNLKANPRIKWLGGGDIEYRGNPGIELKVLVLESKIITWSRQYFAFGCLYEVTVRYPLSEPELKEPQIFLESFNLLGPPIQRPTLAAPKQETLPDFTPLAQNLFYVSPETLRKQALQAVEPDFSKKAPFWEIRLRVTVSPEGKVVGMEVVDNVSSLHEEAAKAVKKWTFKPFVLAGKPVAVQGQLIFKSGGKGSVTPK